MSNTYISLAVTDDNNDIVYVRYNFMDPSAKLYFRKSYNEEWKEALLHEEIREICKRSIEMSI